MDPLPVLRRAEGGFIRLKKGAYSNLLIGSDDRERDARFDSRSATGFGTPGRTGLESREAARTCEIVTHDFLYVNSLFPDVGLTKGLTQ